MQWARQWGFVVHVVSFLRVRPDDQFLVAISPSFVLGKKLGRRPDIFCDRFLVSWFVMKGEWEPRRDVKGSRQFQEHVLQTSDQDVIAGWSFAVPVGRINRGNMSEQAIDCSAS